jgi:hypothetical protein
MSADRSLFKARLLIIKAQSAAITAIWDAALAWQAEDKPLNKRFVTALIKDHPELNLSWHKDLYTEGHYSIIIPVPTFPDRVILQAGPRDWARLINACTIHDQADIAQRMEWELQHWDQLLDFQKQINKTKKQLLEIAKQAFVTLAPDVHSPKHPAIRAGKSFSASLQAQFPDICTH